MTLQRIDVTIELSGQRIVYTTCGDFSEITDDLIKKRFIRDHNILEKQKPFVKIIKKENKGEIGLC